MSVGQQREPLHNIVIKKKNSTDEGGETQVTLKVMIQGVATMVGVFELTCQPR